MARHEDIQLPPGDQRRLAERTWPVYKIGIVAGVAGLVLALLMAFFVPERGWERFGFAYLVSYAFVLSLSVGSLFFVMLAHLFRAGWSILVRRTAEIFAATMPVVAILSAPILVLVLINQGIVYPWAQPLDQAQEAVAEAQDHAEGVAAEVEGDEVRFDRNEGSDMLNPYEEARYSGAAVPGINYVVGKQPWLTNWFFVIRWVIYMAVLSGLGWWFWRQSTLQDATGEVGLTRKMEIFSAPAVLISAFVVTLMAFDLLMSIDPLWYSTIFGVYYFAGSFLGALCLIILVTMGLQRWGFQQSVTTEHFHDLGKLLFAFVFFWGYIAFSQFMLLWYAGIPETAYWFDMRGATTVPERMTPWTWVNLLLLFGHLLIPFAALLSRWAKRSRRILAFWAVWLLVFHWIDLFWLVMPMYEHRTIPVPVIELACLVGVGGLFVAGAARVAAQHSLAPVKDPRLGESLAFHNM